MQPLTWAQKPGGAARDARCRPSGRAGSPAPGMSLTSVPASLEGLATASILTLDTALWLMADDTRTNPTRFSSIHRSGRTNTAPLRARPLDFMGQYDGGANAPTDAHGNPIASYQDAQTAHDAWAAAEPANGAVDVDKLQPQSGAVHRNCSPRIDHGA